MPQKLENYFLFILFIVVTGRILEIKREPTIKGRDVSYDPQLQKQDHEISNIPLLILVVTYLFTGLYDRP